MAGYTSVNGQGTGHYRKQACNKFLQNRERYLGSIKENTYLTLFKRCLTKAMLHIYVENPKTDKIQEW